MMRRMAAPWAAVVMLVVASSPLCAQQAMTGGKTPDPTPATASAVSAEVLPTAPVVTVPAATDEAAPSVADRLRPAADARLLAPAQAAEQRQLAHQPAYRASRGVPLMIVGGAMFLAGAIIDDRAGDAVMVAGVVVAAIGLLEYLQ